MKRHTERKGVRDLPFTGSVPKWPQLQGAGLGKGKVLEIHPDLLHGYLLTSASAALSGTQAEYGSGSEQLGLSQMFHLGC